MEKLFETVAIGFMIDEESGYLQCVDQVKPGDGAIDIQYFDYTASTSLAGYITTFSNGTILCACNNENYMNRIYADYVLISGDSHKPMPETIGDFSCMGIVSDDEDRARFKRAKKFLEDRDIELRYSNDLLIDREMRSRRASLTVEDLVRAEERAERKDYEEGEIHNQPIKARRKKDRHLV